MQESNSERDKLRKLLSSEKAPAQGDADDRYTLLATSRNYPFTTMKQGHAWEPFVLRVNSSGVEGRSLLDM